MMLYYEIKKVFSRGGSKIALIILCLMIPVIAGVCINSSVWVNETGKEEKGLFAIHKLKEATKEWSGMLTQDKIAEVIEANARIEATPEARSEETKKQNIAYGWKQGFQDIRELINNSFCEFREYDYYKADSLEPSQAGSFYSNRTAALKKWLNKEAEYYYTNAQKAYFVRQYEKLKKPLYYEYMEGWKYLFEYSPTILMLMMIILGVLIAPVFSCEKQLNADSIFYASCHGRGSAIMAKIKAGLVITTVIYWLTMLLYTGVILGIYGVSGAGCRIQAADAWKSFYNITNFQEYLIIILGGYLGCLFMTALTMLVSAKSKSTVLAAIVPFILIFAPSFLGFIETRTMSELLGLLPDQLLQMNVVIRLFNVYEIGKKIVGAAGLLFILYILLTLLLVPVIYQVFRKYEVK